MHHHTEKDTQDDSISDGCYQYNGFLRRTRKPFMGLKGIYDSAECGEIGGQHNTIERFYQNCSIGYQNKGIDEYAQHSLPIQAHQQNDGNHNKTKQENGDLRQQVGSQRREA